MADLTELNYATATNFDVAIPEIWSKILISTAEKQSFWNKFEGGQSSGMPIIRKDDLVKEPGDRINIQTMNHLTGPGVSGDTVLQGTEEKLRPGQIYVTPELYRHATSDTVRTQQRINFEFRPVAMKELAYWLQQKMDNAMFTIAKTSATHTIYGGDANSTATLNAGDELDVTEILRLKAKLGSNEAMAMMVNGRKYYYLVISEEDALQLQKSTTYQGFMRDARARDDSNPLFTGMLSEIGGIIIHISPNVPVASSKSICIGFGGEAFAIGYQQYPTWVEQLNDYKHQIGVGTTVAYGMKRAIEVNSCNLECYAPTIT